MTEAAAPTGRVRPDQALPITPAQAAVLQEACATAAAIHSALDLGAGAAPWSLALAGRDPSCRITAVELPGPYPFTLMTGRRR